MAIWLTSALSHLHSCSRHRGTLGFFGTSVGNCRAPDWVSVSAFYLLDCSVDASIQRRACHAAWYMARLHRQLLLQIIAQLLARAIK